LNEIEEKIHLIFLDSSRRAKITPRHESSIQVLMEEYCSVGQTKTGLNNLENNGILTSKKITIKDVGESKFYFPKQFEGNEKIDEKIKKSSYWIRRYSQNKNVRMLGDHLHDVVRSELRVQGFHIIAEKNIRTFEDKKWIKTNHMLDIIAKHTKKDLVVGLEIKNTLYPPPKSEISIKLEMCKFFGITPIFAGRRIENHRNWIEKNRGFLWQFKKQLYPRGQENLVGMIKQRFKFPVEVKADIPTSAIKEINEWVSKF